MKVIARSLSDGCNEARCVHLNQVREVEVEFFYVLGTLPLATLQSQTRTAGWHSLSRYGAATMCGRALQVRPQAHMRNTNLVSGQGCRKSKLVGCPNSGRLNLRFHWVNPCSSVFGGLPVLSPNVGTLPRSTQLKLQ